MMIRLVAQTNVGKIRDRNEDTFALCPDLSFPNWSRSRAETNLGPKGSLLVVVDGMGGTNAGDVASWLAVESIQDTFNSYDLDMVITSWEKIENFLRYAISEADRYINDYMYSHPETLGMGTTIVLCWILGDRAYVAWCGDSRCYVFNPHTGLQALTKDHSYVQGLVDSGALTEEEAMTHPDANLITRGLGDFDSPAEADIIVHGIQPNDVFMLCTDGLCGYCNNRLIENVINYYYNNIDVCCDKLMELALNAGGYDNICIAMASIGDGTNPQLHDSRIGQFFKSLFTSQQI